MTIHESRALIQALKHPERYNHPVAEVSVLETHISWVILTGQFAYKIKKPLDLGFVDFSTLEKRYQYCLEEIRLNSRLAPDMYLGVTPISGTWDQPILDSVDRPIEYAVRMRQFPVEATVDRVVERGGLELKHLDQLAVDIARFHGAIAVAESGSVFGTPHMISRIVQEVLAQFTLNPRSSGLPSQVRGDWILCEHTRLTPMFEQRKIRGFVRECHGDMHLANLVLLDGRVVPFDGIEFSERLRWIDVMNDLAFPVMDCISRGRADAAYRFLNRYLEETGDYEGLAVFRYYQVYRALVRAKVASISLSQSQQEPGHQSELMVQFQRYLTVAEELKTSALSGILLMHGVSGSGKTTVSQRLLECLGAIRVRSDVERKRLFGLEARERSQTAQKTRMYGVHATDSTYQQLATLATHVIDAGYPVIVDATFLEERFRTRFRTLAEARRVPFVIIDLQASPSVLASRVTSRLIEGQDASDADVEVLHKQHASQDPLSRDEERFVVRMNSEDVFNPDQVRDRLIGRSGE